MAAIRLDAGSIGRIKNPVFAAYASQYQRIYDDFMENVKAFGLPFAKNREAEIAALREELKRMGVIPLNAMTAMAG